MSVNNDCATTVSAISDISSNVWSSDSSGDQAIAPPTQLADACLKCENNGDVRMFSDGRPYEKRTHPPQSQCGDVAEYQRASHAYLNTQLLERCNATAVPENFPSKKDQLTRQNSQHAKEWQKERASLKELVINQQSKIITLLERIHPTRENVPVRTHDEGVQTEVFGQVEDEEKVDETLISTESLLEENRRLETTRVRLISTVSALRGENNRLFTENEELKSQNGNLEIELHLSQQTSAKNMREWERSQELVRKLEEDLRKCRRETDDQQESIDQLKTNIDAMAKANEELQKSLEKSNLALTEASAELLELQQRYKAKISRIKAKQELTSCQLHEAKSELSALDGELSEANAVIESYKEEIEKLESRNMKLVEVSQEIQQSCELLQSERKTLEERINQFEERCPRLEEEIVKLRSSNEELSEKCSGSEAEIDRLQGLLTAAADANVKVEDDMQELEQKLTAETLRVNARMVELSQFKTICDEEIERRKQLEAELQAHRKDLQELDSQVQTKETQLQELSTKMNQVIAERDDWKDAYVRNEQNLIAKARRQEAELLQALQDTKDKYNQELVALKVRADEVEKRLRESDLKKTADVVSKQQLQKEVLKLKAIVKRLYDDKSRSKEQFESRLAKLVYEADEERASLEREVAQLRSRCKTSMNINECLRSQLVDAKKELISCQNEKAEAEGSLERLSNQLKVQMAESHVKCNNVFQTQKACSDLDDDNKMKEGQLEVLHNDLKASEKCRLELKAELREAQREIAMLKAKCTKMSADSPLMEDQLDEFQNGKQSCCQAIESDVNGRHTMPVCKPRLARKVQTEANAEISTKTGLRSRSTQWTIGHYCPADDRGTLWTT